MSIKTIPPPKLQEFSGSLAAVSLSSAYPKSFFQASGFRIQQFPEVFSLKYRMERMVHCGQFVERQVVFIHNAQNTILGQFVEKSIKMGLPGLCRQLARQHPDERFGVNAFLVRHVTRNDGGLSFVKYFLHSCPALLPYDSILQIIILSRPASLFGQGYLAIFSVVFPLSLPDAMLNVYLCFAGQD
ncbi:hypothetical protein LJC36_04535 [Desulfovibrio sp. OttesenSCG-928-C14]|nr:hypothetical protein [Desulfovibrio sp. OttesenSCG-928-C14]